MRRHPDLLVLAVLVVLAGFWAAVVAVFGWAAASFVALTCIALLLILAAATTAAERRNR